MYKYQFHFNYEVILHITWMINYWVSPNFFIRIQASLPKMIMISYII